MEKTRSRAKLKWIIGIATLLVVIGVGAAIAISQWLQAQRIEAYTAAVHQTNVAFEEISKAQIETGRATVLFALQSEEAKAFQESVAELSGFTDHYFSPESLEALAVASEELVTQLNELTLDNEEQELVTEALELIELQGFVWQTDFLNLDTVAVGELVESPAVERLAAVPDEDVTSELVEEAEALRDQTEATLSAAQQELSAAQERADTLSTAVVAALAPLATAALETPDQAEVVLEMYPRAAPEVVEGLRASALNARESVDAALFTADEDYVRIPVTRDVSEDQATYEANDAWRATLIATHLELYTGAVTAAWITDADSVEDALGFNPYLPFG